jgi:hypothetical protein
MNKIQFNHNSYKVIFIFLLNYISLSKSMNKMTKGEMNILYLNWFNIVNQKW